MVAHELTGGLTPGCTCRAAALPAAVEAELARRAAADEAAVEEPAAWHLRKAGKP